MTIQEVSKKFLRPEALVSVHRGNGDIVYHGPMKDCPVAQGTEVIGVEGPGALNDLFICIPTPPSIAK